MFGLAIIFFLMLYAAIWVLVTLLVGYLGWRFTKSKKVMLFSGLVGFAAMYWPAFGDLIPTLSKHKELCEKEAGFKVYVTPEQWDKANPGILESLIPFHKFTVRDHIVLGNERLGIKSVYKKINGVPVTKRTLDILDLKTNEVLARDTDFSRGYGNLAVGIDNRAIKFWLHSESCYSGAELDNVYNNRLSFYRSFKMEK